MDSSGDRGFEEVEVGNFAYQSAEKRFGDKEPPESADWRMNLTVLSQRYNLYFVAYKDVIHVIIPRGLKQALPSTPDVILAPPRSQISKNIVGYIDDDIPHSMNHMIIGNLGSYEVLLMVCDDGDIIAYYTHQLHDETHRKSTVQRGSFSEVTPLFHENVNITAWGIAMHDQSRLIAVSSNRREITVFALAIGTGVSDDDQVSESENGEEDGSRHRVSKESFPLLARHPNSALEGRQQGYRLVFNLRREGHNIPSIDFSSGEDFEAESIFATDIRGSLWSLDLWSQSDVHPPGPARSRYSENRGDDILPGHDNMGWGVMTLLLEDFRVVSTPNMACGGRGPSLIQDGFLDIGYTTNDVRDSAATCSPSFVKEDETASAVSYTEGNLLESIAASEAFYIKYFRDTIDSEPSIEDNAWYDFLEQLTDPNEEKVPVPKDALSAERFLPDHYSSPETVAVIQAYRTSVQLLPFTKGPPITRCSSITIGKGADFIEDIWHTSTGPDVLQHHRLNMLVKIPELSLLIVASQMGRVAVFTLTRLENGFSEHGPVVMFRLEYLLPFANQYCLLHPPRPLLGIAVSPQPSSEAWDARKSARPRRWRLMLTYFDSSVVSYELSRGENDDVWIL